MNPVCWIVVILIALKLLAELVLLSLNRAEIRRHASAQPPFASAIMDAETYGRSVAYSIAKSRFASTTAAYEAFVLGVVVFSGLLPAIYLRISRLGAIHAVWPGAAFLLLTGLLFAVADWPFDLWAQFRLEEKFGFNRSTLGLWIGDKLKGLALSVVIGFPLLWVLLELAAKAGPRWWIWAFAVFIGFQLAMLVLYPKLILPLFNKLTPLPEGELRTRLINLGNRTEFVSETIEVMDGSKRSGHSNAFFTGFGRFRRIVLFDTLIARLKGEELEAVLAHEIGHYRLRHIPKTLAVSSAATLAGFAILAWLSSTPWFNEAFGFAPGAMAPTFLLFGLLGGLVIFWLTPVLNLVSRKHEFEADAFASRAMGDPSPLISALRGLARDNLSNLTPHPLFAAFHYSHPTSVEREARLLDPK